MRYFPVGLWTNFSDHGTVNKASFTYYNADHHGSAMRVSEGEMRSSGGTPASQDVVAAYGNSDEGDVTAGILHTGPADADWVGRAEAGAFIDLASFLRQSRVGGKGQFLLALFQPVFELLLALAERLFKFQLLPVKTVLLFARGFLRLKRGVLPSLG